MLCEISSNAKANAASLGSPSTGEYAGFRVIDLIPSRPGELAEAFGELFSMVVL